MIHLRRLLGFGAVPALSMVAAILLLPIISSRFGPAGWSAVALGQSIGAIVAVFGALNWPIVGGQIVAELPTEARRTVFRSSLYSRGIALLCGLPVAIVALYLAGPDLFPLSLLFMIGTALNALTASWFWAGVGTPWMLIRNEALPRLAGYALSIVLISTGVGLWSYGAVLVATGIAMPALTLLSLKKAPMPARSRWNDPRLTVRHAVVGGLSRTLSQGFYYSGPMIVGFLAPTTLASYSAFDQVQKALNNGLQAFPQAFTRWVGSAAIDDRRRRAKLVLVGSALIAGAIAVVGTAIAPEVINLLFSGLVRVELPSAILLATAVGSAFLAQSMTTLVIVPLGYSASVYVSMVVATLVALPALCVLVVTVGLYGALAGGLIYSVVQIMVYTIVLTSAGFFRGRD